MGVDLEYGLNVDVNVDVDLYVYVYVDLDLDADLDVRESQQHLLHRLNLPQLREKLQNQKVV